MSCYTETQWVEGTDDREYLVEVETGLVLLMERPDYEALAAEHEAEMFAEFGSSWIHGGGSAADVSAAWAQHKGWWKG